jgi:hypothetical protein
MYVGEYLVKERHQERLRRAQEERAARQVTELRRLERRSQRAERELLAVWQRVEQLRSALGPVA